MNTNKKSIFSIIIPIYYNELNLPQTVKRLIELQKLIPKYEVEYLFVDDGSGDNSLALLLDYKKKYKEIKIVKLSRNFGSMAAVQAGLNYVSGSCIGIISADLQEPPELFVEMIESWEQGNKIVMAARAGREDPINQKIFSNMFYLLLDKLALRGYPKGGFDFVLFDRQVLDEIKAINEKNTNIMNLLFWTGHKQAVIPYTRKKRAIGKSKWTLTKKFKLFIDSFVNFSYAPIRIMSLIGIATSLISFFYGIFIVFNRLFNNIIVEGWASIAVIISFLLGIIMFMLGIIGEYLWRILDETRKRPSFIVDEIYE
jgi:polyisoprenyl-phosphate glycosyltransferase